MTLKEKLAEKKAAMLALKERIEADDAEAIAEGEKLQAEIEETEADIETAEKKAALLEKMGKKPEKEDKMEGIKGLDLEGLKANRGATSVQLKANTDIATIGQLETVSEKIVAEPTRRGVRDLFSAEQISGNALTYFVMENVEGQFNTINQGETKNQINVKYDKVTRPLEKIGAFFKESDELLSDAPYLESAIRSRGVTAFRKAVETGLVTDLMDYASSGANVISFDNILDAKMQVKQASGLTADAMIIHPDMWAYLMKQKDANSQYILGGPGFGAYGNGTYTENPRVWGLEVVESDAVPANTCIVGAFKEAGSVVTKANEGLRVEVSNSDVDDFQRNLVTVRIEERTALAVRAYGAFFRVGGTAPTAASSKVGG